MANYLGKISAVVVANTTGWQKNLNSAAADLRKFAATVQRDVTKASTDANKAFNSMLTPLQRLERSLKAASAMKLSFRGLDGAMRTVEQLRDRLTRLNQTQVDLVVKASGLKSISQFRDAIQGIDQKTLDFAVRFGGVEKLKEFRRQIESVSQESVGAALFAGRQPGVTNAVERLKELRRTVSELSGKPLQLALKVGGEEKISRIERDAIGLSKRDLSLFVKVGGRENLDRVIEDLETVDNFAIDALVKVRGKEGLDDVIERFSAASPEQINAVIKVLGENDLTAAADKMRALASAGRQVFEPLASVASGLPALGISIEQAFTPGLAAVQSRAAALKSQIDQIGEGGDTSRLRSGFDAAAASARRATESFVRLQQVAAAASGFDPGTSFQFVQPEAASVLARANRLQQEALQLSPSQLRQGNFAFRSSGISAELDELSRLNAAREAVFAAGPSGNTLSQTNAYRESLSAADAAIVTQTQKVSGLLDVWERVTSQVTDPLVINQGASTDITAYLQLLDQIRTKEAQIADNRRRAEFASSRLVVDQRESALLSDQGRATRLPAGFLQSSAESAARRQVGAGTDPGFRQLDQLAQKVSSLRAQIDTLPASIGSQLIPQLRRAEQEFVRLRTSGSATASQIDAASSGVQRLGAQINRINQAQGIQSFADGLDDTALRGALGNLNALQQILNRVGAAAGSNAASQFDRMRAAIQRATLEGTIGTEAFQNELRQLSQEAAKAAAATGRIGQKAAFRQIRRGGDIARGGFDKLSLGAQQAAFAIDDFFSVTGDISQKIRAVQNNITQLAFVVGGTAGLFAGLGVALAAQLAVAVFKFGEEEANTEDKADALTSSVEKQKSAVEELKEAFRSLSSFLSEGLFSQQEERVRALNEQIEELNRLTSQARDSRTEAISPLVLRERAIQSGLNSDLGEADTLGERIRIQREITESRDRESRERDRAIRRRDDAAAAFDGNAAAEAIRISRGVVRDARSRDLNQQFIPSSMPQAPTAEERDRLARLEEIGADRSASSIREARDALVAEQDSLRQRISGADSGEAAQINRQLGELERQIDIANAALGSATDSLRLDLLKGAEGVRSSLSRSRDLLEEANGGFGSLASEQKALADRYSEIKNELTENADLTLEEVEARGAELDAIKRQSAELESAATSTAAFADALDRVASQLADTVLSEAESTENKARRERNRRQAELNTLPADASPADRRRAERDLFDARVDDISAGVQADEIRRRRRELRADRERAVEDFEKAARAGTLGAETQRDIAERDSLLAKEREGTATADDRARRRQLDANLSSDFEFSDSGVALGRQADQIDIDQQEFNTEQERRRNERERRRRSAEQGQDLLLTPAERTAREGTEKFNDAIEASLSNVADNLFAIDPAAAELADGVLSLDELAGVFRKFPGLRQQFEQDLQTARDNIAGNIDAELERFDRNRTKPSRAAIQAQDVNTQQGRAELNRLLRGDDANRDKPVLEGIKQQVDLLTAIDRRIAEVNQTVGVAGA